VPLKP